MKITISGIAGSGKTTLGKALAEELSAEFVSVGSFSRELANNTLGMDINQFQEYCKSHPEMDMDIDHKINTYLSSLEKVVADYRLGPKFIPEGFHVFLEVSESEAHRRITNAKRSNEKTTKQEIKKRNKVMRQRFIQLYGFDFLDKNNYNLILNTEQLGLNDQIDKIIQNFYNSVWTSVYNY